MIKISALFFTFFIQGVLFAQLVNIESSRIQSDSIRKAGNANVSFSYQKNNGKPLTQLKTSAVFQLKTKNLKDIFLILGSYDFSKTRNQQLSNAAFGHLRYNRFINNTIKYELYTQIQANQLLNLRSRYIAGTGLRFKFVKEKIFTLYVGISSFYEYEESIETTRVFRNDFRMSDYLVLSFKFPKNLGELTSTTYYQPLYDRFSDYRLSNQTMLSINFTKNFAFTSSFSYTFDQNPPIGISTETISFTNGIRYSL